MVTNVRNPFTISETLTDGTPNVRAPIDYAQVLTGGVPKVRVPVDYLQALTGGNPKVRIPIILIQALIPVPPEKPVATDVFPTLIGLTFDIKKSPEFNSAIRTVISGRETSNAYMEFPWWHFEVTFDVLPDIGNVWQDSPDLRVLGGFIGKVKGRFKSWLFHDVDDYFVVGGPIATGDGVTLQFPFVAQIMGQPLEPIGQVDLSTLVTFASTDVNTGTDAINVLSHGLTTGQGPVFASSDGALPTPLAASTAYWIIRVDADHFKLATSEANAIALTAINLTAAGSGNDTLTKGIAVYDNGVLLSPADWSLTLPNQLVFGVAPVAGHLITADFEYYFVCRFENDKTEFNQMMSKIWELQKLQFKSVIP